MTHNSITLLTSYSSFSKVLDREIHALEFIVKWYVPQGTVSWARNEIPGAMHDWIILSSIKSNLERLIRMTWALSQQSWQSLPFIKKPHFDWITFVRSWDEHWLVRHELDMADLLTTVRFLQRRAYFLLVQVPEHDILSAFPALGNTCQQAHLHLCVSWKGQAFDWAAIRTLIEGK